MKILLLGTGAREHALAEALSSSPHISELVVFGASKNPGILPLATRYEQAPILDFHRLRAFVRETTPDLAMLGPDDPIGAGVADLLEEEGVPSIGPSKKLAQLESSKSFTRALLQKYQIQGNPLFQSFSSETGMSEFAESCGEMVVKADGLCGGKGVCIQGDHFSSREEGLSIAKSFLARDGKVVLEEKLIGEEFSLLFFCDGVSLVPMPLVQDHKRAFSGDRGPNTGGMGTISDANHLLPFITEEEKQQACRIGKESIAALQAETGGVFRGILFGGFMATSRGVRLIEWNVRFGDPEALNLLSLLKTDFGEICLALRDARLSEIDIQFFEQASVAKYAVPQGYPGSPATGALCHIRQNELPKGVKLFFGSVEEESPDTFRLSSSRSFAFLATANTISEAEKPVESAFSVVSGPVSHREDIGTALRIEHQQEWMSQLRSAGGEVTRSQK